MRVAITGVPGTGKTTISKLVAEKLKMKVVHLIEFVKENQLYAGYDKDRQCPIVDISKLRKMLEKTDNVIFESHFAEEIPADVIIVLRLDPRELLERLLNRRYPTKKAYENALAEALDTYDGINVDTTGLTLYQNVEKVVKAIKTRKGDRVDWNNWLEKNLEKLERLGL